MKSENIQQLLNPDTEVVTGTPRGWFPKNQNAGGDMKTFLMPAEARWMIVDDNADILLMMSAILENLTCATIECYDTPQSALAAFKAAPESYQLVITDFEMPGMNGIELCRRIRDVAPEQKIFLATGSGYFTETSAQQAGFAALLDKPFPISILKKALDKTFGRAPKTTAHELVAA